VEDNPNSKGIAVTQDEIIEMAKQAGLMADGEMWFSPTYGSGDVHIAHLETFGKLVAEKEREACAKEADKRLYDFTMLTSNPPQNGAAWSIASAIRARGQA
jgi:hypothetical protein